MQTKLINLTTNAIKVVGMDITIEPSGYIARVDRYVSKVGDVNGVPLLESSPGRVSNIPEPSEGILLIVPSVVRELLKTRQDLVSPAKFIRDGRGVIIGCAAFERNPR